MLHHMVVSDAPIVYQITAIIEMLRRNSKTTAIPPLSPRSVGCYALKIANPNIAFPFVYITKRIQSLGKFAADAISCIKVIVC